MGEVAAFTQSKNEGLEQKPNPKPTLYKITQDYFI